MRTVAITELRQRVAELIEATQASDEPTVVLQRSRIAAYILNPDVYERDQAELRALRRALFLHEVREAEAEYRAGSAQHFDDIEELLDAIRS